MRVLIAFDKFKDAINAREACAHAAHVLRKLHPDWVLDLCPLTDGGDGFADVLTSAVGGSIQRLDVSGPLGRPVRAAYGLVGFERLPPPAQALLALPSGVSRIAVIEMAQASGLSGLAPHERDPWQTSSLGTGELIRAAALEGAQAIVLGVGGSATHDLGLGALTALGLTMHDDRNQVLSPPAPAVWKRAVGFGGDVGDLPPIRLACDVTNPLLGPNGAAAVFGAQKGLKESDRHSLEELSARWSDNLCRHCGCSLDLRDRPGAGAAGGIGFGLMAAAGARLLPGFPLVAAWLGIEGRILAADMVITGEGRFDESSLSGKGPGALTMQALAAGRPVHLFAGETAALARPGLTLHPLTPPGTPLAQALSETGMNLATAVTRALG